MQAEYVKKLDFDSDTFADMKRDLNAVFQKLLGNMTETDTTEGSIALKIDVTFIREFIPNYDPAINGETRCVHKPQFKHQITSSIKINDKKSGNMNSEMELVWDEELQMYVMQPVANTSQRTIFDADFREVMDESDHSDSDAEDVPALEGSDIPALPGPEGDDGYGDYDYEEPGDDDGDPDDVEDITDELI